MTQAVTGCESTRCSPLLQASQDAARRLARVEQARDAYDKGLDAVAGQLKDLTRYWDTDLVGPIVGRGREVMNEVNQELERIEAGANAGGGAAGGPGGAGQARGVPAAVNRGRGRGR